MSECTHDCSTCSANCGERKPASLLEPANAMSIVKKVIAVVSGKGGVGKSLVTSMLAINMQRRNLQAAVLDADITGPTIPTVFGLKKAAKGDENGIYPVVSKTGIRTMSINNLLTNTSDPVVWRGPVIAGAVKQFWSDVMWGDVDFMFVDMPPGTGDVPLTVFQSFPVDGIVVVTSPQELVSEIVAKAVKMANMMNIPIVGIVENMSYVKCPDCGKEIKIFGDSHIEEIAAQYGLNVLGKIPVNPEIAKLCDSGMLELYEGDWLDKAADAIEAQEKKQF